MANLIRRPRHTRHFVCESQSLDEHPLALAIRAAPHFDAFITAARYQQLAVSRGSEAVDFRGVRLLDSLYDLAATRVENHELTGARSRDAMGRIHRENCAQDGALEAVYALYLFTVADRKNARRLCQGVQRVPSALIQGGLARVDMSNK